VVFKEKFIFSILPIILIPLIFIVLQINGFLTGEATGQLGWLMVPWILQADPAARRQGHWLPVAIFLLIFAWVVPMRTLLFFAGFVLWISAVAARYGRVSGLIWIWGIAMSPVYFIAGQIFTFPLRLRMTEWAGALLQWLGRPVRVEGNLLVGPDQKIFAVEPACEGLALLQTATLLLIFLLVYEKKRSQRRVHAFIQIALLLIGILLTFGANLARMALLVWFNIPPETAAHELIGLAALAFYVLIPAPALNRVVFRRLGKPIQTLPSRTLPSFSRSDSFAHLVLTAIFILQVCFFRQNPPDVSGAPVLKTLPAAFVCAPANKGVTQCHTPAILLYVKPIPAFYSSEHNPALCWQGSGYTLSAMRRDTFAGIPVYAGRLQGPQGSLLTAWWYDNGRTRTLGQWDWRFRQARGEPAFSVVNVSVPAANGDLEEAIRLFAR
jgi:exosortase N